ncbi:hypothetical protein [Sphingobacterium multivorum]|uniref:hypothetical protein n=1 Tax=Sphingobacterium multivorum TaxID=28454 RepID=UPI003DA36156
MNKEKKAPVRQIKFRGLRVDGKGWVYGSLVLPNHKNDKCYIIGWNGAKFNVIPETVGQFIANNGKQDFYIGDIVINPKGRKHTVVIWDNMPCLHYIEKGRVYFAPMTNGYLVNKTVIGNIYQESDINSIEGKEKGNADH